MPLPVIANTIRTTVVGHTVGGHKWSNVLHFRKTGGLSFTGAIAILDPLLHPLYDTAIGAGTPESWKAFAPIGAGLENIEYTPLDGVSATSVFTHIQAGTVAGDALPANVALVITLRTALRGRAHRGRVYWGPSAEGINQSDGTPGPNAGFIATQWTNWLGTLTGSGVSLVVASYKFATAEDVVSVSVDQRWDTQRRRLNV